ncbi:MAG TPA: hypothetical protein VMF06_00905 [Candidatus Limnocylindria bacterium]|jgi:hypothetical protein|nr:hypothetical protein [Candidatus Limnocylindria bacterium]
MDRRSWSLLILLCVLGGAYAFGFSDWFARKAIHVSISYRPPSPGMVAETIPMVFGLDEDYALTQIKVSELPGGDTNAPGTPTWSITGKSSGEVVRGFYYGEDIKGLAPVAGLPAPHPLKPGATYRLDVAAGKTRGTAFFSARAPDAPQ